MGRREKIAEMLAARPVCREGSLSFSCSKVEFSLKVGECAEGSFTITGRDGMPLLGAAVTEDIHMRCLTAEFTENPSEIFFRFDSKGLDAEETSRGEFKIISNQGEYTMPYIVSVLPNIFETSLGQMKNLFHFANLAKTNWKEAVKIFYSPGFEKILAGNDRQYVNGYRALSAPPQREQKVEEFLLWIRKKKRVEYMPDRDNISCYVSDDITREVVALTRSGWGYTHLSVEVEGAFLQTEKDVLTDDDFLGNLCSCGLLIIRGALHGGRNYGKVRFFNEYVSVEIPVCVTAADKASGKRKRNRKRRMLEFYQCYLRYSMGKMSKQQWLTAAESIVAGMDSPGRVNPVRELFQAHILLTKERRKEAKWLLERVGKTLAPEEAKADITCYYLYLTTLVKQNVQYAREVAEEIRRIYRRDQTNWGAAWLLLCLDEEYGRSLSRKWVFLEQQFEQGCRSPVWYLEGAILVRKNPAFLMKPTPFVMQTLNFMAKYDYLSDECIRQVHYLAGRLKHYSERMYAILQVCYEKKRDTESLRAICALLITGNKIGPAYARWYRMGIENELWLTRLYECYILSIDLEREEKIPAAAVRYFSYRSELPWERTAYLYAYVVGKRETYPELYRMYLSNMEKFLAEQLARGRMNRDIAFLYRGMIQEGIAGEEMIGKYADRLFVHEIRLAASDICRVVAVHGKLKGETVWPVRGTCAYVPLYDNDVSLIFEKTSGGRFVYEIGYEDRTLFYPEEMLFDILPEHAGQSIDQTGVVLYQCERGRRYTVVDRENVCYARSLWSREELRDRYRNELGMKLLQYYSRQDMQDELESFLPGLRPEHMNARERAESLQCMILQGMYDTAYEWLAAYGADKMRPKPVARLCSRLLAARDFGESETMTALVYFAFRRGKYDEDILLYLSRYFIGTVREMGEIWHACERFDAGCYELCEKVLLQMLFTGEYIAEETDIFRRYLEGSAKEELTERYLEHVAYRYLTGGKEPEPFIWRELGRRSRNGEQCDEICELAMLKSFAARDDLDEEECMTVQRFLDDLVLKRGMAFGFFRKFADRFPALTCCADKTFLECRSDSENPLILHYMIGRDGKGGSYRTDELKGGFAGIYVRSFQLFADEKLQYYITEKRGETEELTESGILTCDREAAGAAGRFGMINRFLTMVSDGQIEKAEKAMEEYYQTEFYAENLFSLL